MKRFFLLTLLLSLFFISCETEGKGTITVFNDCTDNITITDVYTKESGDYLWNKEFSGSIKPGQSCSFDVDEGDYIVGVSVARVLVEPYSIPDLTIKTTGTSDFWDVKEHKDLVVRYNGMVTYSRE